MKPNHQLPPLWTGLLLLFVIATMVGLDACQRNQSYHTSSGVKIPKEVQQYLTALSAKDVTAQQAAFAKGAVITDEINSFDTEPELTAWLNHFNAIHKQVEVLSSVPTENGYTLLMRWTPHPEQYQWTAYYTFEYKAGRITRLHIHSENAYAVGNLPDQTRTYTTE